MREKISILQNTQHETPRGFTLLELVIVVAITAIIATLTLVATNQGEQQLSVDRSAQVIASTLREAQNDALGGEQVGGSTPQGGFGVYLHADANGDTIFLFADINNNHLYNAAEEQRTIRLEQNVTLQAGTDAAISFVPPRPDVYNGSSPLAPGASASLTVANGSYTKVINVNSAGAIWVQ